MVHLLNEIEDCGNSIDSVLVPFKVLMKVGEIKIVSRRQLLRKQKYITVRPSYILCMYILWRRKQMAAENLGLSFLKF